MSASESAPALSGDELLQKLAALANPHRLRIIAALAAERNYISQLARDLGMSRPLLHMHLQRLEASGLITSSMEVSEDGKAMKYVEAAPFVLHLTPQDITEAVATLGADTRSRGPAPPRTGRQSGSTPDQSGGPRTAGEGE
ncbi:winged helix-turn-helix domain-containing protein [Streptomyces sp. ACA25]|uniref:ArsR/SmtB family transcription factor n=1 Tax=Streptomyces sp. ACA25 TaxID=3022596 RepID=UPI002306E024|nr:winged helix-turn-helix domain-containing protein [Streptomyces sp. ACA25]MDB1086686.1 winged helix-turn-helix domain-containing protein [Streptomyces sp. ACA25]